MNDAFTTESAIFGHVSPETARLVDDYPYGRRVRTQIRYWIETVRGKGDRFVSQTLNPKTGRWNNPKRSTYSPVMVMYVDPENGHVKHTAISTWADDEWLERFRSVVGDNLNPLQLEQLAEVIGLKRAFEGVEFSVRTRPATEEQLAEDRCQERLLAQRIAAETAGAAAEVGA